MKVFNSIESAAQSGFCHRGLALTIGDFDGCHKGHIKLLEKVKSEGKTRKIPAGALTFLPSPKIFFAPQQEKRKLYTEDQKSAFLESFGMDFLIVQDFNEPFSDISHQAFVADLLVQQLRVLALVLGENFRFGKHRRGDVDYLESQSQLLNFCLYTQSSAKFQDQAISSSRIRTALELGDIAAAKAMLGHNFQIEGVIEKGQQIGRTIGFPTANLGEIGQLLPKKAVYAGYLTLAGEDRLEAVVNIGSRPTLSGLADVTVEAHILDYNCEDDHLYGKKALLSLVATIRDEVKFGSLDELKEQISKDCELARSLLEDRPSGKGIP